MKPRPDQTSRLTAHPYPFVLVLLLFSMGFSLLAVKNKSVTIDEFHHLPAGRLILATGEFYMHSKSPPLARVWSALPGTFFKLDVPTEERWKQFGSGWGPWVYGTVFLLRNQKVYDRFFFWGRFMNVLWILPLGLILFAWSSALYGRRAAWFTLVLMCFSPTLLAHGPLVTTDLAGTTCFFAAIYFFWKSFRSPRIWLCLAGAGISLGLGLLVKFTLVLVPVIWTILAISLLISQAKILKGQNLPGGFFNQAGSNSKHLIKVLAAGIGFPVLLALLIVNAGYGFKGSFTSLRNYDFKSTSFQKLTHPALAWMPAPVPSRFLTGLDKQKADSETGEFPTYLNGRWSRDGWWYYTLEVFLIKTPLPLSILLILVLFIHRKKPPPEDTWTKLCVWVPVITLFVVLSFLNRLNVGIRYFLPAMPFLFLFIGRMFSNVRQRRGLLVAGGLLALWFVGSSLMGFPHYLAYFNELIGGPSQGHKYLVDSNLDWGQDLKGLKRYMDENRIDHIKLAYFGHVWPELYGISYTPLGGQPESGHIAISATYLAGQPYTITYGSRGFQNVPPGHFQWLQKYTPVARIGHSIFIYNLRG